MFKVLTQQTLNSSTVIMAGFNGASGFTIMLKTAKSCVGSVYCQATDGTEAEARVKVRKTSADVLEMV